MIVPDWLVSTLNQWVCIGSHKFATVCSVRLRSQNLLQSRINSIHKIATPTPIEKNSEQNQQRLRFIKNDFSNCCRCPPMAVFYQPSPVCRIFASIKPRGDWKHVDWFSSGDGGDEITTRSKRSQSDLISGLLNFCGCWRDGAIILMNKICEIYWPLEWRS